MHTPENTERQGPVAEKKKWQRVDKVSSSCRITSDKAHRRVYKDRRDYCVAMAISSKGDIPTTFRGISDNHGRLHP